MSETRVKKTKHRSYKNISVNKKFRVHFGQYFFLLFAGMIGNAYLVMNFFWNQYSRVLIEFDANNIHTLKDFIMDKSFLLLGGSLLFSIALMATFYIYWSSFSHTMIGPVFRLENHLAAMINDEKFEPKEICFREDDEFQELAVVFNAFITKLKEQDKQFEDKS